jgi:hypothetical protein
MSWEPWAVRVMMTMISLQVPLNLYHHCHRRPRSRTVSSQYVLKVGAENFNIFFILNFGVGVSISVGVSIGVGVSVGGGTDIAG